MQAHNLGNGGKAWTVCLCRARHAMSGVPVKVRVHLVGSGVDQINCSSGKGTAAINAKH